MTTNDVEIVTYREDGYTWKGRLVLGPTTSTNGTEFVCIDSFAKRIRMSDVVRIDKLRKF
jgi:hypothetical protein